MSNNFRTRRPSLEVAPTTLAQRTQQHSQPVLRRSILCVSAALWWLWMYIISYYASLAKMLFHLWSWAWTGDLDFQTWLRYSQD